MFLGLLATQSSFKGAPKGALKGTLKGALKVPLQAQPWQAIGSLDSRLASPSCFLLGLWGFRGQGRRVWGFRV